MPQLTVQRPRVVTLDRICDALDSVGRGYVVDVHNSRRTVMVTCPTATSYVDLVSGVVRIRSVWRGIISSDQSADLLPYVSHHNRESVGPKVIVYPHEDHFHLWTQTNVHAIAGIGDQQLEAYLLLALIMMERFIAGLEEDFAWSPPPNQYFFHHGMLGKQHLLQTAVGFSDNSLTAPISSEDVAAACERLQVRVQRNSSVFRTLDAPDESVLRLFGENTWLSVSNLLEIPVPVPADALFYAVNRCNFQHTLGITSILGLRKRPYLRFDYLVSVGEGMTQRQLDTEILAGIGVTSTIHASFQKNFFREFGLHF